EEFKITFPILFTYTVPIWSKSNDPLGQIGAGVLVQVGCKLLIATAAHCIENDPFVLPETGFPLPPRPNGNLVIRRVTHERLDVGVLELDSGQALEVLRQRPCSLGNLSLSALPTSGMFHIVGYPRHARKFVGTDYEVTKQGFGTTFQGVEAEAYLFP